MNFPEAPAGYSKDDQDLVRHTIIQADGKNRKTSSNVEIGKEKLVLTSPNGARWNITVDNAGTISAAAL